jgi:tetratricopeptide (TPR) repeat protein
LELHAISQKISEGVGRFEITMPSSSSNSFLQATHMCYDDYFMLLSNVDAEYSVCSREADRESIHKAITDSIGFDGLNRSIYSVISQWIIDQMKSHISLLKMDPLNAVPRMKDLGMILNQMGRHEEALLTLKDALQMYVQVGSVAPTNFGTTINSEDAEIDRQIVRIYVHLGQYHSAQSQHDALCARHMSRHDHVFSLKHGGSDTKDFLAQQDRDRHSGFLKSFKANLEEIVENKGGHGMSLDEEGVRLFSRGLRNITASLERDSKNDSPDSSLSTYKTLETMALMAQYTFLILEEAEDAEFRALLQSFGIAHDGFNHCLLEEIISDPLSTIQWKKQALDLKSARLPCAHPAVASAMLRLAHAYVDGDQIDLALPLLQQCLPLLRRLPPFHFNIALALLLRAACLVKNGHSAAAAADVAEAQSIWNHVNADTSVIPDVIKLTAEQFQDLFLKLTSLDSPDDRDKCVSLYVSVIRHIGTDEARLKRVIINRAWDAEHYDFAWNQVTSQNFVQKWWRERNASAGGGANNPAKPDVYVVVVCCFLFYCSVTLGRHDFFKSDLKIPTREQSRAQHEAQKELQFRAAMDGIAKDIESLKKEFEAAVQQQQQQQQQQGGEGTSDACPQLGHVGDGGF